MTDYTEKEWPYTHITIRGQMFIAWDETESIELGEFLLEEEAAECVREHAKTLFNEVD